MSDNPQSKPIMKIQIHLALLITVLLAYHPGILAAAQGEIAADEQPTFDADSEDEFNQLSAKAAEEGSIPVMVVLKEGRGKSIAAAQNALIKGMPKRKRGDAKRLDSVAVVALSANVADLKRLHDSPGVERIVADTLYSMSSLNASMARVGADAGWGLGYTGAGQTIAMLDIGIDKNHPFLVNKVVSEACFSTKNKSPKITPTCRGKKTRDVKPGAAVVTVVCNPPDFGCAHGNLVSGIAAGNSQAPNFAGSGVAPLANIIAVKVDSLVKKQSFCGSPQPCTGFLESDIIKGLEYVYKLRNNFKIAAVNFSLGAPGTAKQCKRSPIKKVVAKLRSANIATISASGNAGKANQLDLPACVKGVIAVGAVNDSNNVASFSNSSADLALLAPGTNIGFIMPGIVAAGQEVIYNGTSPSSALVSGAWAALKSHTPNATVDQILSALIRTGVPVADPKNGLVKPRILINQAHSAL